MNFIKLDYGVLYSFKLTNRNMTSAHKWFAKGLNVFWSILKTYRI